MTDALPSPERAPSLVYRLLLPLLGWTLLALFLWKGLGSILVLSDLSGQIISLFVMYLSSATYVYLACRHGDYPKRAWLLGLCAVLAVVVLSRFSSAGGEDRMMQSILFLMAAPLFGDMISRMVEKKEYLLPVMVVAALADAWSVFAGPSKILLETDAVKHFVIDYPIAGHGHLPPTPFVGFVDWVFTSMLILCVIRFGLSRRRLLFILIVGFSSALIAVHVFNAQLPLLTFLAPVYALGYLRELFPSRKEIIQTLCFLGVMGAVMLALYLAGFAHSPEEGSNTNKSGTGQSSSR